VFDWLFEGWLSIYLALAMAAVVLLVVFWRTRQRKYAYALGVVVALVGGYWLLDVLVETDREEITRSVREIAKAAKEKKTDDVFRQISDGFALPDGRDKSALRATVESIFQRCTLQRTEVWDFTFSDVSRRDGSAKVSFHFKAEGSLLGAEGVPFDCDATYHLDPDKRWRLISFRIMKFGTKDEIQLHY